MEQMYKGIKRLFDLISSAIAIIITSPLWIFIAIGIKVSSKGPIFYRAERIGKNLKPFTLLKFRSMHVYDTSIGGGNGEKGFIADEDRIFTFGGFLRKSKLDELPQLLNVFMSQMSVIGPRPMTDRGAKKFFIGEYTCIPDVKPGLACLDSLFDYAHGELFIKDEYEYAKRVLPIRTELARMYVEKKGICLDIYCIARTIQLMFEIVVRKKREFPYTKYEKLATKNMSQYSKVKE